MGHNTMSTTRGVTFFAALLLLAAANVGAESAPGCKMSYDDVLATCREARGGFAWTCERHKMTTTCPTIEVNLQCDWNAKDGPAAIKNKPDLTRLPSLTASGKIIGKSLTDGFAEMTDGMLTGVTSIIASGGITARGASFASLACASADTCCVMVDKSGELTSGPCDDPDLGDQVTANYAALAQQANEIAELKKLVHELLQKTP